jgi:uncharacterized membrane protein
MALGPIEVLLIGFPGNQFNGEIVPEIERLINEDVISLIDALLLTKDENGDVVFTEFDEEGGNEDAARLAALIDQIDDLISDEDVDILAAGLEPNSSAAILIFEHTWAKPLRDAITASGGVLAAQFRVPGPAIDQLLAELAASE